MEGAADPVFASFAPTLATHGGALLVAGVLPLLAYFLLDGVVALARGRGVVLLLIAVGMLVVVGGIGATMWTTGLAQLEGTPTYEITRAGAEGNAELFVGWAFGLGAIAFLARMANLISPSKSKR